MIIHPSYTCGTRPDVGREVYKLANPVTGLVTITLTPHVGDVELVVLGANADGGCNTGQCVDASQQDGTAVEQITLNTIQGQTYYFVVDS